VSHVPSFQGQKSDCIYPEQHAICHHDQNLIIQIEDAYKLLLKPSNRNFAGMNSSCVTNPEMRSIVVHHSIKLFDVIIFNVRMVLPLSMVNLLM
jgi:hypothetical protein